MAIAHRATTSASFGSGTSNTVGKPAGTVSGDYVGFQTVVDTSTTSASAPTGGSSWGTALGGGTQFVTNGDGQASTIFHKIAGASEPASYTINPGTGSPQTAVCTAYSGVDAAITDATPVINNPNSVSVPSSPVTITWNSITTVTANAMVLLFATTDWNSGTACTYTDPASTNRRVAETPANFTNGYLADFTQVSAGATGSKTGSSTRSGNVGNSISYTIALKPDAGSGSTGTLAKTNANDTSAASGTTTVVGTLAKTNANDTSAAAGTTTVLGTLARTNANDTLSASGSVGSSISGTLATTNANDTLAAAGTTTVVGSLARTSANDTASAAGTTTVVGTLATTNAPDTVVASGAAGAVTGTASVTNANDTASASGVATEPASPYSGGWPDYESLAREHARRRKKLEDEEPAPAEVVVIAPDIAPPPRRTITRANLVGRVSLPASDAALEALSITARRRRQRDDEELLLY